MIEQQIKRVVGLFLKESIEGLDTITFNLQYRKKNPANIWIANDGSSDIILSLKVMGSLKNMTIKTTEQIEIPFITESDITEIKITATNNAYRCQIYTAF